MEFMRSPTLGQLLPALRQVQAEIPVVHRDKTADIPTTKGRMRYTYADLEAIWRAVKPILSAHGFTVLHPFGATGKGTLQTILAHDSEEWIGGEIPFDASDADPRKVVARATFMRRLSVAAMLEIVMSDEDSDASYVAEHMPASRPQAPQRRSGRGAPSGRGAWQPPTEDPEPQQEQQAPPTAQSERSVTAQALIGVLLELKKKLGGHPAWVSDAIVHAIGCSPAGAVTKSHIIDMVDNHQVDAAALFERVASEVSGG